MTRWRAKAGFRSLKDTCAGGRPLDARSFGPQWLTLDYHDPKKLAVHNGTSCTVAGYREQHSGADQKQPP
jgi:hypothetical protein